MEGDSSEMKRKRVFHKHVVQEGSANQSSLLRSSQDLGFPTHVTEESRETTLGDEVNLEDEEEDMDDDTVN